ncbi:MAG TPA: TonB family protein [Thermoanaerobaculia bacterium]
MSWIVVLESKGRPSDSVREILAEDGWLVDAVPTVEKAAAAIAERSPQLVIANIEVAGSERLLAEQSRARGGPGSLALVAAGSRNAGAEAADEQLRRPFTDHDLRATVRNMATPGRAPKSPPPAADGERLTSKDLFGDLLAEVEGVPSAPPAPPKPPPTAAQSALDRQLGSLLAPSPPARPAAPRREEPGVDDLLSQTLSGLEMGDRAKKPTAKPARAAAPTRAATPAAAQTPAKPAPAAMPAAAAPRRASKELDLSSLDELARRPVSDKTPSRPDTFATQRIAVPTAPRAAATPAEFGQYTLLERIALGGMAEVWKARMKGVEGFRKTVAIKKILPHLTDSTDFVTMFVDEAKLAAQLNHTNIIHIYDLGKIADDYYIAMEYVDGKDLRTILNAARERDSPLPLSLALLVASRLAAALDHAHRQKDFEGRPLGLVHRDVSPQNVLISFDGDIKLCDFGIVKAVSKASKTQMGALKGKLQYMSPEQAWGRPVDARSDIFSLGTLLFEMLTGRRLFAGESEMSVLDAVREGRIQAPRDLDPRIPLEVNATVLKALSREPKDRYGTAGDLQREIDAILASLKPAPSQRDLALYVQRLFDVGARPTKAAAAAERATPAPAPVTAPAQPVVTDVAPVTTASDAALEAAPGARSPLLWIGVAALVVLAVVGITMFRGAGDETANSALPAVAPPTAGEPTSAAESDAAGAPAEAAAAPPPETAAPAPPQPTPQTSEPAATTAPAPPPAPAPRAEAATPRETSEPAATRPAAAAPPEPQPSAAATPSLPPPAVAVAPAPETAASRDAEPAAPAPETAAPARPTTVAPAAAPAQRATAVREGDLVSLGAGVAPPVLVSVDKPQYPPIARRMRVEGTVNLSVLVDENGRVLDVRLDSGVSQNVGINEAALDAARSAKFKPATKDGVRVKVWHRLTIPFKL